VPRPDAHSVDDGYIITVVHDLSDSQKDSSCLEILDGLHLEEGPVATVLLHDLLPPGLHGSWLSRHMAPMPGEVIPSSNDVRVHM
jgi:carotenoid cleavage dioxygenase-like enzyme